ncbi:MAG TPA: ornithine--oxo-acid transaminase [Candidatus Kapabacteria bacterium]|jgi:ornithine--oxo-acid transaminase|nr:ornithine--oxo-acid transaminase [Candidatus Kapabacteria bacterium]HPU23927.1 ornithine--oxo-acid transaminase [Candidatus Kapabacteria bacterium]
MKTQDYIAIENEYGAHNYHPLDVVVERAEGCFVYDVEGKKYLDCLAAYSAVNQGHCHPKIKEAFIEQVSKVTLTSRAFRNDKLPMLYKKMHELTGYDMFLPMNSGAEAVETAIKLARRWGYDVKGVEKDKAEIIVASGNFHGRTTTIVGFSDDPDSYYGYGPYCKEAFPMHEYGNIEDLKSKITKNTVGVLIEPIQGEGGVVIPPEGYLKSVEQICRENNILFICDEIQSGLGRAGKLFAHYYEGVRPDIVIVGKALSGGFYPVSGVLADKHIMLVIKPGQHGSTFGGNPLAAAVAIRALDVLIEEKMIERSAEMGEYFINKLRAINNPKIKIVRGRGLWIGLVLNTKARPYCVRLMEEGMLCKDTHETIIRIAPPLVITKEEIDWAVATIEKVLNENLG